MIGMHLLGGVGGLLSGMMGSSRLRINLFFLISNEVVDWDRSAWYGVQRFWGPSLLEWDAIGGFCLIGSDCGGGGGRGGVPLSIIAVYN